MDDQQEITWNEALENIIAEEGEKASGLAWLHHRSELYYSRCSTYITLPVIGLSTINGFLSGASSIIFNNTTDASIGIGAVSLFTALLSTVGQFFGWTKRTENHRISSIQYLRLSKFINVEMSLPQNERMKAKDILKVVREQSERLMEISPQIPEFVKKDYQVQFKTSECAVPEIANGIHKIQINRHRDAIPTPTFSEIKIPTG